MFKIIVLFFALGMSVSAQTIRGIINDGENGLPLQFATITLKSGDKLFGATTNSEGYYIITRIPEGKYTFEVRFVGYKTHQEEIQLRTAQILTRNLTLLVDEKTLDGIEVTANANDGGAEVTAGLQTIRPIDIERIPTPDVSGDLASYISTQPGVVTEGDRGGQLFIRGGTAAQNLVQVDKMTLYQPFHVIGFYSAFPSDVINKADIYAGGYGAKFGGRLSSVIDISTRSGNKRQFAASASVAPFMMQGRVEFPIVKDKISFLANLRQSVVENIGAKIIGRKMPYNFGDQFAKLHFQLTDNAQLALTGIRTFDVGLLSDQAESDDASLSNPNLSQAKWTNQALGARVVFMPPSAPTWAEMSFSYSNFDNQIGLPANPERRAAVDKYSFETNFTYFMGKWDLNFGFFVNSLVLDYKLGGLFQNFNSDTEFVTEAGTYAELDLGLGNRLRVTPGGRLATYPRNNRRYIEPRLKVVWFPDKSYRHKISGALGIYHQEIVGVSDRRDLGDVFTAWTTSPFNAQVPTARHALLGWNYKIRKGLEFSIEGYVKDMQNLGIPEWSAFPRLNTRLQLADGTAHGVDTRLEGEFGNFYVYLTYGYGKVEYTARQVNFPIWFGTDSVKFPPSHDRRHQGNALLVYRLWGFEWSARFQYGSGLPFTQAIGFDDFVLLNGENQLFGEEGDPRVLYGPPYASRLPSYHRLDVSVERSFQLAPKVRLKAQAGLTNAYDRQNLFYFDLFSLKRINQLPRIPSLGIKFDFN